MDIPRGILSLNTQDILAVGHLADIDGLGKNTDIRQIVFKRESFSFPRFFIYGKQLHFQRRKFNIVESGPFHLHVFREDSSVERIIQPDSRGCVVDIQ